MNKEIIHKYKSHGITECGKDISEMKPNETIITTGMNENVTCLDCKVRLNFNGTQQII